VHLGTNALIRFFLQHRDDTSLVLVTVIGIEGSTYRKPGAMMLISEDEQYEGMISGGCLEGDLLHHASKVFETGTASLVTYDMHADEQLVWSLGLGCDGIIHLLLQRLDNPKGFEFLHFLQKSLAARKGVVAGLVTSSVNEDMAIGSLAMVNSDDQTAGPELMTQLVSQATSSGKPDWRYRNIRHGDSDSDSDRDGDGDGDLMLIHVPPYPRVLLCGAGPDAVPVARQLRMLDWDCHLADHRPAFAREDRFAAGCVVSQTRPEALDDAVDLAEIDAAVIMSHHLENDAAYLRVLASSPPRYVGVLGPSARRDRLLKMAECEGLEVFGPVGLDIGAEMPEAIALAIAAEIHAVLNRRDGHSLTNPSLDG